MLKNKAYLSFVFLSFSCLSHAKTPYGMAGCGWGSQVMGPDGNQVFASTTNGSSYNQLFGISAGTSNCLTPSQYAAVSAQQAYMQDNYQLLSKEVAQGGGESVRGLADTLGCQKDSYNIFSTQMQTSYSKIFAVPGSMAALDVIKEQVKANADLARSCSLVI